MPVTTIPTVYISCNCMSPAKDTRSPIYCSTTCEKVSWRCLRTGGPILAFSASFPPRESWLWWPTSGQWNTCKWSSCIRFKRELKAIWSRRKLETFSKSSKNQTLRMIEVSSSSLLLLLKGNDLGLNDSKGSAKKSWRLNFDLQVTGMRKKNAQWEGDRVISGGRTLTR